MNTKDDCKRQYNSKWLGIKIKKKESMVRKLVDAG